MSRCQIRDLEPEILHIDVFLRDLASATLKLTFSVQFNLQEELKKSRKTYDIPSLFSVKTHMAYVFAGQRTIPASEELSRVIERQGVEKAVERFHKMKNQFRKIYRFDISEQEINALATCF